MKHHVMAAPSNQRRGRTGVWAIVGLTGLLVAACSGGPEDAGDAAHSGDGSTQNGDAPQSPLAEYLGDMHFRGSGMSFTVGAMQAPEMSEEERQNFRRVQDLIAECMREEGFEYVPLPLENLDRSTAEFDEAYSLEPAEFARQYGYGISTLMHGGGDDDTDDPNKQIRDGLSDSAREAYDQALWGDFGTTMVVTDEDAEYEGPVELSAEDMGCEGEASEEVYGGGDQVTIDTDAAEFNGIYEDLTALYDRIRRDPRLEEAVANWAHCMADNGHSGFEDPEEPQLAIFNRMGDAYSQDDSSDDADAVDNATVIGRGANDTVDPERLAEVQEYERDIATADHACRTEHYEETYRDVAYDMEREFVETNRAELERYRDWLAENGGVG